MMIYTSREDSAGMSATEALSWCKRGSLFTKGCSLLLAVATGRSMMLSLFTLFELLELLFIKEPRLPLTLTAGCCTCKKTKIQYYTIFV